jgi:uncharacterized protein YdeI (YjbR/CyaY-like superfamily)
MTQEHVVSFATAADLHAWLASHHATATVLWVQIFKKGSGTTSVTWNDCVVAAIAWGWIDGQKKSLDDASYLQRLTPRRLGSNWSKINVQHAERLIADGDMHRSGMAQVEAAQKNGRWAAAYAGSADMTIPEDFLAALKDNPAASATYDALDRASVFVIYHRLQTARQPGTRQRRIAGLVSRLAQGVTVR